MYIHMPHVIMMSQSTILAMFYSSAYHWQDFRKIWGGHISPTAWLLNKLALKGTDDDLLCRENRITLWGKITSMHVYPHATCDNDTCYVLQFCLPLQLTAACYLQIDMFAWMCNCKERKGHCCHMLCLLYNAFHFIKMEFKSVPLVVSKTSLTQIWHIR